VEKELTGQESEPSELIYFKVYKSNRPRPRRGHCGQELGLSSPRLDNRWWIRFGKLRPTWHWRLCARIRAWLRYWRSLTWWQGASMLLSL
jgi:hypothetical protein